MILSGSLPRLSVGRWLRLFAPGARSGQGAAAAPSALSVLRRVNLQVEELDAYGVPLGTTRIDATADASSTWTASLVGANVLGEILVPADSEPVLVHMDRLSVPGSDEKEDEAVPVAATSPNPTALPAFRFTCAECKLGDRALGTVDIVAHPDPLGTRIPSFYMRGQDTRPAAALPGWSPTGFISLRWTHRYTATTSVACSALSDTSGGSRSRGPPTCCCAHPGPALRSTSTSDASTESCTFARARGGSLRSDVAPPAASSVF